jgi:hypothetical protein
MEVSATIKDLLMSPVLRRVLCNPTDQFSWRPNSMIQARLSRKELGAFDCLTLGLLLMSWYKGPHIVVPDLGFYGRNMHVSLVEDGRLVAGVDYLDELKRRAPDLRDAVMRMDKKPRGAIYADAEELARYDCKFPPHTDGYDTFIKAAMA